MDGYTVFLSTFKGFCQFGDFESRQIDGRQNFVNFMGRTASGTENRGFWKAAIFGVTEVGTSGGACWRRRLKLTKF